MADIASYLLQLADKPAGSAIPDGSGGAWIRMGGGISTNPMTGESSPVSDFYEHVNTIDGAVGTHYQTYDAAGKFLGDYTVEEDTTTFSNFLQNLALVIAATYTAGALGAGGTASTAGGSGAWLGEGVASGVPAWDAAATSAGLSLETGGLMIETAADAFATNTTAAATTTAATTAATSAGSVLSGAGALTKVVGTVGAVLGAVTGGGSNPTRPTTTTTTGPTVRYTSAPPSVLSAPGPLGVPLAVWAVGALFLLKKG